MTMDEGRRGQAAKWFNSRALDGGAAAIARVVVIAVAGLAPTACSFERIAVDRIGDALARGGGVYMSDDDPELIREAIPFGLKTYESLLAVSPEHRGLILAAASGFAGYAYLLQDEADRLDAHDLAGARALRARARNLYLRGRDYALRGLATGHDDFAARLYRDRAAVLGATTPEDVPLLYWAGAAWAGALSAAKDDFALIAELAIAAALVQRALDLDDAYDLGAAHEFFVAYEGGRPGGSAEEARRHYRRALELSRGTRASVHLALAESVAVSEQNLEEFQSLIDAALAVDVDRVPELRLLNTIAQRRARWLRSRVPTLFVAADQGVGS